MHIHQGDVADNNERENTIDAEDSTLELKKVDSLKMWTKCLAVLALRFDIVSSNLVRALKTWQML